MNARGVMEILPLGGRGTASRRLVVEGCQPPNSFAAADTPPPRRARSPSPFRGGFEK